LVPEDVAGCEVTQLADAEAGVEEGPDDEPLGGRLTGVRQAVRFGGGARLSHVLIRQMPPPEILRRRGRTDARKPSFRRPNSVDRGQRVNVFWISGLDSCVRKSLQPGAANEWMAHPLAAASRYGSDA